MAEVSDLALQFLLQELDRILERKKVSPESRKVIRAYIEQVSSYIEAFHKVPDKYALAKFLESKVKFVSSISGSESFECYVSLAEFASHLYQRKALWSKPPYGTVLVAGLTLLDALDVGNSCSFAPELWYTNVLVSSSSRPHVRAQVLKQIRVKSTPESNFGRTTGASR